MTLYTQGDWLAEHPDLKRVHDAAWRQRVSGWRHAGETTFSADTAMWLIDEIWEMTRQRNDSRSRVADLEEALRQILGLIEGNLESTARDIINGTASGNDVYDDAEQISAVILQALGEAQTTEGDLRQQLEQRERWLAILDEAIPPCRFHDRDREGCLAYTGRVPCEVEPEESGHGQK